MRFKLDKMSETEKKSSNPRLIPCPMQDSKVSNVVSKSTLVEQSASMVTDKASKEIAREAAEEMGKSLTN